MFEEKIIKASKEKIASLYKAADISGETPDTGVKIIEKSAYFIIRDCANFTKKYLPLFLYGKMKNPIKSLKGKFTDDEIRDFIKRCSESKSSEQLLTLILKDIHVSYPKTQQENKFTTADDEYDLYSKYGMAKRAVELGDKVVAPEKTINVADILINAFKK